MQFFYTTIHYVYIICRGQDQKKVLKCNFKFFCWHTFVSNLIFFHPTCLFRPTCLIFMQNCLPNMFIQDNTSIRGIRVHKSTAPWGLWLFWYLFICRTMFYNQKVDLVVSFWRLDQQGSCRLPKSAQFGPFW